MSSPLESVCNLNRMGSSLVSRGDFTQGIKVLRQALITLKTAALELECPGEKVGFSLPARRSIAPRETAATSQKRPDFQESLQTCHLIYSRTVELCLEEGDGPISVDASTALYTGGVLFNLGVAYHLQAQQGNSKSLLTKALYLYKMSIQALEQEPALTIATIAFAHNNQAICFAELSEHSAAQATAKCLLEMLFEYPPNLEPRVVQAMELNSIMMMSLPPTASRAA